MVKSVCVFCGSRPGVNPAYLEAARALGGELARRGLRLVFGGSVVGLMGALADAAMAGGADVVGVIPRRIEAKEIAHRGISTLHVVETMHERKALMERQSDAFIAMPGGFGTYDELFEIITWYQLGIHSKPIGLLDVGGYFQPFRDIVRHGVAEGFIPAAQATMPTEADPAKLLDLLCAR